MTDILTGDEVILTLGKKKLSKYGIPSRLRKLRLHVLDVDEDNVYIEDPMVDDGEPVSIPLHAITQFPLSPSQQIATDAFHKFNEARQEYAAMMKACMSKKDYEHAQNAILAGRFLPFTSEWWNKILNFDKMKGWEP